MPEKIEQDLPESIDAPMQALDQVIRDTLRPRPYMLLVFDANLAAEGGRFAYVTNAVMEDMVALMEEFIEAYKAGLQPTPESKPQ